MERRDVEVKSGGETCRGWLYLPDHGTRLPGVEMAHGLSGVKEPKSLVWLPCVHHDVYDVAPHFQRACGAAIAWFLQHLPRCVEGARDA